MLDDTFEEGFSRFESFLSWCLEVKSALVASGAMPGHTEYDSSACGEKGRSGSSPIWLTPDQVAPIGHGKRGLAELFQFGHGATSEWHVACYLVQWIEGKKLNSRHGHQQQWAGIERPRSPRPRLFWSL